jgi:hypothetical protein
MSEKVKRTKTGKNKEQQQKTPARIACSRTVG